MEHRLEGDIDLQKVQEIYSSLREGAAEAQNITIDCSKAGFVGTAAFQMFFALQKNLQSAGNSLTLKGLTEEMQQNIALLGLQALTEGKES